MKRTSFFILFLLLSSLLSAQNDEYRLIENISYIHPDDGEAYRQERCKLDLYYPADQTEFPTIVWFHGGGLEGGDKHIPEELKNKGFAVAAVNYRLSPKATNPAYIEDAAEAVAWVFKNIASYGGSPKDIYVAGHSAGGYLTLMVGLDKSYLEKYGIDADSIKALMPISGQTNTHFTIKKERGLSADIPVVDEYAPLSLSRKGIPPTLLITGERTLEFPARYEENAHLAAILQVLGNKDVVLYEMPGFNHGTVCVPAFFIMNEWIKKYSKK